VGEYGAGSEEERGDGRWEMGDQRSRVRGSTLTSILSRTRERRLACDL